MVSELEAKVMDSEFFNRLHFIMQNSLKFFVFPSMVTTRFIHSVGVMHIATQVLSSALSNADKKAVDFLFEEVSSFLDNNIKKSIMDEGLFSETMINQIIINNKNWEKSIYNPNGIISIMGNYFIDHLPLPSYIVLNQKKFSIFLYIFQAIRLASLFHDIGHLPYSHLSEEVIEYVLDDIDEMVKDNTVFSIKGVEKIIDKYYNFLFFKKGKIHEVLGKRVVEEMLYYVFDFYKEAIHKLYLYIVWRMTLEILEGEIDVFKSLKSIISNDIDADRLDFVLRDGYSSGLFERFMDINRIVKMFVLKKIRDEKEGKDRLYFLPAVQSLSDIEKVLLGRFKIYKDIISHHKGVKMDYLLVKIIQKAIKMEILSNVLVPKSGVKIENLINDIDVQNFIHLILTPIAYEGKGIFLKKFSQLTDYWLLSLMNRIFFILDSLYEFENDTIRKEISEMLNYLREFYSASRKMKSLWKQNHEYRKAVRDVLGMSVRNFNEKVREIKLDFSRKTGRNFYQFIESILTNVFDRTVFVVSVERNLRAGIHKEYMLVDMKNQDNLYKFDDVSNLRKMLETEIANSILFYVFMEVKEGENIEELRYDTMNAIKSVIVEGIIEFFS
jgi:HD superfamily phosphohydrolase